ncbi:MAG: hypothetical protein F6J96_24410 [Symploca sp. SIO1C2]|nr:hypothetical protein [Symploca sp. SIO1C2]
MTNLLQKIWLIFIVAVLVVIIFLPTSNPAYTEEDTANTLAAAPVEAISTLEPVHQPTEEVEHSTKITSVEQVSDVSSSEPYFNALKKIIEVYKMNLTLPDGSFPGNQSITRGDFIIYLRDTLEVMNKLQERSKIAGITDEQLATTAAFFNEIEDKTDVISQRIKQINNRIYLLENKLKESQQPLLIKTILDSSLTSKQNNLEKKDWPTGNTIPEVVVSQSVNSSEPEIDLLAPVNPVEEILDISDIATVNTSEEVVASQPVNLTEEIIDVSDVAAVNTSEEVFASQPVNPSEEILDVTDIVTVNTSEEVVASQPVNLTEEIIDVSDIAAVNTSEEVVASQPVNPTEEIIDVSDIATVNTSEEVVASQPVNSTEEIIDVSDIATVNTSEEVVASQPVNLTEEILDITDVTAVNTPEEVVVSNQVKQIEEIQDVSLDDPYYDALREIMENYQVDITLSDGNFQGNQPITRSEVIIYLNDSIAATEELIALQEEDPNNSELELSLDNLSLQIAQTDSYFAEKLAQIEKIESQLDELEDWIVQDAQSL